MARGGRPNLLVLNQYYRPAHEADGQLLAQLCESLADEYDVTVLTGRVPGARRPGASRLDGVTSRRLPSTMFGRSSHALRAANYASYAAAALPAALRERRPDVVLAFTNPPFLPASRTQSPAASARRSSS